jgi:hypothetical protein
MEAIFERKKRLFVKRPIPGENDHTPQVIEIKIVEKDQDDPDKGCVADPSGDIEVWAGDTIRYINTLTKETYILGQFTLFNEWIPIPIAPNGEEGDEVEFTVSGNFLGADKFRLQLLCDSTPGGPRFVPKP